MISAPAAARRPTRNRRPRTGRSSRIGGRAGARCRHRSPDSRHGHLAPRGTAVHRAGRRHRPAHPSPAADARHRSALRPVRNRTQRVDAVEWVDGRTRRPRRQRPRGRRHRRAARRGRAGRLGGVRRSRPGDGRPRRHRRRRPDRDGGEHGADRHLRGERGHHRGTRQPGAVAARRPAVVRHIADRARRPAARPAPVRGLRVGRPPRVSTVEPPADGPTGSDRHDAWRTPTSPSPAAT